MRLSSSVMTFNDATGSWTSTSISLGEIDGAPLPACSPGACSDGNPCTTGTCNLALGCEYANNSDPCEDGELCSDGDVCSGGVCTSGGPLDCDDADPCTAEACDQIEGCTHTPIFGCNPAEVPAAGPGLTGLLGLLLASLGACRLRNSPDA